MALEALVVPGDRGCGREGPREGEPALLRSGCTACDGCGGDAINAID